jgi:hypothetical protein
MNNVLKVANVPSNCRYKDGPYNFQVRLWRTNNGYVDGGEQDLIIDNWWPFVEQVEMNWGNKNIYDAQWVPISTGLCVRFEPNTTIADVDLINSMLPIEVTIHTSEPMQQISLSIDAWDITNIPGIPYQLTEDEFRYKFTFPASQVDNFGSTIILEFQGLDYSGNELIAFEEFLEASFCESIPSRGANGFVDPSLPPGTDIIHRFYLRKCNEIVPGPSVGIKYDIPVPGSIRPAFSSTCSDGSVDIQIGDGVGPFKVQWYKNDVPWGSEITTTGNDGLEDLVNVTYGSYTVKVKDALCGSGQATFLIGIIQDLITVKSVTHNSSCYTIPGRPGYVASGDGSINVNIQYYDDFDAYTFMWTGPPGFVNPNPSLNLSGLCPGTYTLTATNMFGCQRSVSVTICCCGEEIITREANFSTCQMMGNIPYCNYDGDPLQIEEGEWYSSPEGCNGFIFPDVSGGVPPLMAHWEGPIGFERNTYNIDDLCPGEYCLTVSDGCSSESRCWEIIDCSINSISIQGISTPTCDGYSVGSINVNVNGGELPYSYLWSNQSTSTKIENLAPGNYSVTVTDANHCSSSASFTVGTITTNRDRCIVKCGNTIVENYGPEIVVVDENNCDIVHLVCDDDRDYIIDSEEVGTYIALDDDICQLTLNNRYTEEPCPGSVPINGVNCKLCIFGSISSNQIVSCNWHYCYFSSINSSVIYKFEDFEAIGIIEIPDKNGDCAYVAFQIYDSCIDPDDPAYTYNIACNASYPYSQESCGEVYSHLFNRFLDGNLMGECLREVIKNQNDEQVNRELLPGSQEFKIVTDYPHAQLDFMNNNTNHLEVVPTDHCNNIILEFASYQEGNTEILFRETSSQVLKVKYEYQAIIGVNTIIIDAELYRQFNNGKYEISVNFPSGDTLKADIDILCNIVALEPESKLNYVEIIVSPNPVIDFISISGLNQQNANKIILNLINSITAVQNV